MNILPYYKIERTEDGKEFFFSNFGYFNFWDKYLIMHIPEGNRKVFSVLVNRPKTKFNHMLISKTYGYISKLHVRQSIKSLKPEEMFKDFPELKENYSYCLKH